MCMSNAGPPPMPGCARPARPAMPEKLDTAEGGFIALKMDDEDFMSSSPLMSISSSDPSDPSPLSRFSSSSSESPTSSSESNISCDPSTGATRSSTASRSSRCSVEFSSSFSSSSLSSSSFSFASFAFGLTDFASSRSRPSWPSSEKPLGLPFGMNPGDVGAWRSPAPLKSSVAAYRWTVGRWELGHA